MKERIRRAESGLGKKGQGTKDVKSAFEGKLV